MLVYVGYQTIYLGSALFLSFAISKGLRPNVVS